MGKQKKRSNKLRTMSKTFSTQYRVMYHNVDLSGQLSVPSLGDYILDTAGLHATQLGISMQHLATMDMTWVMSGLHFEIGNLPMINSTVEVRTQISGCSKISSKRDFIISCNGDKVAEASTEWLIINTKTRRPIFLTEVFPQIEELIMPDSGIPRYRHLRFRPSAESTPIKNYTVEYSDIDINTHLYSMRYLEMSLNSLGLQYIKDKRISRIDANFMQEVLYGGQVAIFAEPDGSNADQIEMQESGKAMFRARIETEPRTQLL